MLTDLLGVLKSAREMDLKTMIEQYTPAQAPLPAMLSSHHSRLELIDIEAFMREDFLLAGKDIDKHYFRRLERHPERRYVVTATPVAGPSRIAGAGIVFSEKFDHLGSIIEHEYVDKLAKNRDLHMKGAAATVLYTLIHRVANDSPEKVVSLRAVGDKNPDYYRWFMEELQPIFPSGFKEYGPQKHQNSKGKDVWVYLFNTNRKSPEALLDLAHSIAAKEKTVSDIPKKGLVMARSSYLAN